MIVGSAPASTSVSMAGAAVGWRRGCSMRGMVVGRIDEVKSAEDIVQDTVNGFHEVVSKLTTNYGD